ncbi:Protein HGH1-like [Porphyridium purpureum]|uniref:Protein HGH1 homolog n=1 Tax=Porphyridium purpureum TaxID=35688 RepID=A0A5J4YN99_PORPP|nr:Protein HGH1-like [Porphyridium purpureum]|eukprot:POR7175..scf222_8
MAHEVVGLLPDIVELLGNARADIRGGAATVVAGYSGSEDARRALYGDGPTVLADSDKLLESLMRLLDDTEVMVSRSAYSALINFAIEERAAGHVVKHGLVDAMVAQLADKEKRIVRVLDSLRCSVIANLTRHALGAKGAMHVGAWAPNMANKSKFASVLAQGRIVQVFDAYNLQDRWSGDASDLDPFESYYMFMANLATVEEGRTLYTDNEMYVVREACKVLLSTKSTSRKLGMALLLRNVLLDTAVHERLVDSAAGDGEDVLCACLIPLLTRSHACQRPIEAEELQDAPQKIRDAFSAPVSAPNTYESCADIRLALAEALLALCKSRMGRELLRSKASYPILRCAHAIETNSEVEDVIHHVVDRTALVDEEKGHASIQEVEDELEQ